MKYKHYVLYPLLAGCFLAFGFWLGDKFASDERDHRSVAIPYSMAESIDKTAEGILLTPIDVQKAFVQQTNDTVTLFLKIKNCIPLTELGFGNHIQAFLDKSELLYRNVHGEACANSNAKTCVEYMVHPIEFTHLSCSDLDRIFKHR